MSRELKFRAWDEDSKEMITEGGFIQVWGNGDYTVFKEGYDEWADYDYVIMQFTGLKDKNGVEVYEGDIIKELCPYWAGKDDFYWTGKVVYVLNPLGFIYEWGSKWGVSSRRLELRNAGNLEVIGNIYENPELLED